MYLKGEQLRNYEAEARAAELEGKARAARLRAEGYEWQAAEVRGDHARAAQRKREHNEYIASQVAAGRMCPGGCDTLVGGCIKHADRC
jgi:hypothetical protein